MTDDFEISKDLRAKQEYDAALYLAAIKAANIIEAALAPGKTAWKPFELVQANLALKLLAIVQRVPSPERQDDQQK